MNKLVFKNFHNITLNSIEYVKPGDNNYGSLENGTWNGLVKMVSEKVSADGTTYLM